MRKKNIQYSNKEKLKILDDKNWKAKTVNNIVLPSQS